MSRPFLVAALVIAAAVAPILFAATARAQDPVRPWLDWKTLRTANFRIHYPAELEEWTLGVAATVEAIDTTLTRLIGYATPKPIDVVVDDPFGSANGYALPFLDRPVTVWWTTPPEPRSLIGNYANWAEMLAVHELAHLSHLTRPSRNRWQRTLWRLLPAQAGPLVRKTPRWLYEGYATHVEGLVTGTGRPQNAWRPALLRQWAIEGALPSYGGLSSSDAFYGGVFAYINGSAFIDWLVEREGENSLPHLWRRLSARIDRGFTDAFSGVYGDSPAALYGRHAAELTRDAMAAREALARSGLVEGELLQRLEWLTGDPAISPDGERVAITLRERDRPGRLVVWSSHPEIEDTAALRRRVEAMIRDPLDVPARRFHPVPKAAEHVLPALNGRSYQMPRWFADSRRVLATRWTQRADGTVAPALYVWDTELGDVRRVTPPVGVLHGDPHPNGDEAVAMQCHWGHCDVVHVNLARGSLTTLLEGTPEVSYYRPRYSPDGARFVSAVSEKGRWRILLAQSSGARLGFVGPDDGANRYDAAWLGPDSLVVVSEHGGVPNLEIVSVSGGTARPLTRVTGAAVGPDVNRADRSVWFLTLHARGLDVRRVAADSARPDSVVRIDAARYGFAGARTPDPRALPRDSIPLPRAYGSGPRHQRWLPGGHASADGAGVGLSIYSGDIVGRLTAVLSGTLAERGAASGGSIRATWRRERPAIELGAFGFTHEPSRGDNTRPSRDTLDASLLSGQFAVASERHGEGRYWRARLGGGGGTLTPRDARGMTRALGFAEATAHLTQMRGAFGVYERLSLHFAHGNTGGAYQRVVASLSAGTMGRDAIPFSVRGTVGRVQGDPIPFERFTLSGGIAAIADSSMMMQRYALPMYPTGLETGRTLVAWRAAVPLDVWTLFYEGASVADDFDGLELWRRAIGLDVAFSSIVVPVAFAPRVELRGGFGYLLDHPFRKKVRTFFEMRVEP